MTGNRPTWAEDPDADLELRLERALRDGLGGGPVSVDGVASGTRSRVRRARARRRRGAVAGGAVLVAAVPLVVALGGWPGADRTVVDTASSPAPTTSPSATPATTTTPPATSPATTTTSPTTSPAPHWAAPAGDIDDPKQVEYRIPKAMAFTARDLSRRMTLLDNGGDDRLVPTTMGQACGSSRAGDRFPVAARSWLWAEEDSNRLDQLEVDLVVTGWATGTGPEHWRDLVEDRGVCRFMDDPAERSSAGLTGDDTWAASGDINGLSNAFAAVRLGDLVVAVQVIHPDGQHAAVQEARRLAGVAARNAQRTGLTDTAG